jgi:hypothetical protein
VSGESRPDEILNYRKGMMSKIHLDAEPGERVGYLFLFAPAIYPIIYHRGIMIPHAAKYETPEIALGSKKFEH